MSIYGQKNNNSDMMADKSYDVMKLELYNEYETIYHNLL